jgi:hypothetical protein
MKHRNSSGVASPLFLTLSPLWRLPMWRTLLTLAALLTPLHAVSQDNEHDYSRIDCSAKDFLVILLDAINEMPSMKAFGGAAVDISDATTVSASKTQLACHLTLTFSDSTRLVATIFIHDNSIGQPIFQIVRDAYQPRRH